MTLNCCNILLCCLSAIILSMVLQSVCMGGGEKENKSLLSVNQALYRIKEDDDTTTTTSQEPKTTITTEKPETTTTTGKTTTTSPITTTQQPTPDIFNCFCETTKESDLTWPASPSGMIVVPLELCVQDDGQPVTRKCLLTDKHCVWGEISGNCSENISDFTKDLYDISINESDVPLVFEKINSLMDDALSSDIVVSPADINIISNTIHSLSDSCTKMDCKFIESVHRIMYFNKDTLQDAQTKLNSTDKILYALDTFLLGNYAKNNNNSLFQLPYVIYSYINNSVIGIKLSLKENVPNVINFESYDVDFLYKENYSEVLQDSTYELAVVLPEYLIEEGSNILKIILVFYRDFLFYNEYNITPENYVVSVLVPNHDSLTDNLQIITNFKSEFKTECVHWKYGVENYLSILGNWTSDENTNITSNGYLNCYYNHLTHFSMLVTTDDTGKLDDDVLDIVTIVGLSFSVPGLIVILFSVFVNKIRREAANQLIICLSFCLLCEILFLYLSYYVEGNGGCIVIGVFLHYSILSSFIWMSIISYSSYRRLVGVFNYSIENLLNHYYIAAFTVPLIPIFIVLIISPKNYSKNDANLCYLHGYYLYFAILLPAAIMSIVNLCSFIYIIKEIHKISSKRIIIPLFFLYFMMGLNWIFTIFIELDFSANFFSYLFEIFTSFQGFVVFIYFVVYVSTYWKAGHELRKKSISWNQFSTNTEVIRST